MINIDWKKHLVILFILLPTMCIASVPAWKIIPTQSTLTFTATQNDAPVTGQFKSFTGDINFDPKQLSGSHVKITIDTSSISDPYNQLSDTLKTPDWFDVQKYPQAIFQSTEFVKTGNNTYQSKGNLTLRDKTLPVTLVFSFIQAPTKVIFAGSTAIKRRAFGVGQGEWADTKTVKDDVKIDFTIAAVPAR